MPQSDDLIKKHRSEAAFHDDWAHGTKLEEIAVCEAFEAPTAMENRLILKKIGPLKGLRVLDVGSGLGESSVYLAMRGAQVSAADVSPGMIDTAVKLGKLHGVQIKGLVCAGESLNVPEGAYDVVYLANTIHHVADRPALFAQIHRALRPGGRFFSFDPLKYNPAIKVYRKMATEVRTVDETPLSFADVALAKKYFINVGHREFWIASLALFLKYFLVDRVHPNADRYWKRIFKESAGKLWWWWPLRGADAVLTRIPLIRRLAWNMVMWGEKAAPKLIADSAAGRQKRSCR